jgi:acetylornithine deacetylase/succinyl-diaminopimelate desuccinylase-like protein
MVLKIIPSTAFRTNWEQLNDGNTNKCWKQHNVVPSECDIVVDIRVNDCYSNHEILAIVKS